MNIEFIQKLCLAFPHATENLQWGEVLCFKIGGKLFAVLDLSSVPPCLSFKCDPEKFSELVERDGITPARYFGRYQWVSLERVEVLPWSELRELLGESYVMVAARAKVGEIARKKPRRSSRSGKVKR